MANPLKSHTALVVSCALNRAATSKLYGFTEPGHANDKDKVDGPHGHGPNSTALPEAS